MSLAPYHPPDDQSFVPFAPIRFPPSPSSIPTSSAFYPTPSPSLSSPSIHPFSSLLSARSSRSISKSFKEYSPRFQSLLSSLESQMNVLVASNLLRSSVRSAPYQFNCWVSLPTNQKENICIQASSDFTFETLFVSVMHTLFPNETPSPEHYYFLNLRPEKVLRIEMGEFVETFAENPWFLLRHREHGLQGAVINDTVSLERLDQSFLRSANETDAEPRDIGLFSEFQLSSLRITAQDSVIEGSASIEDLLQDDDVKEMKVRLPAISAFGFGF